MGAAGPAAQTVRDIIEANRYLVACQKDISRDRTTYLRDQTME